MKSDKIVETMLLFCFYNNEFIGLQEAKDPLVKAVLDGRQLALKVTHQKKYHLPTFFFYVANS